jgi:hypothetical protein
MSMLLSFLLHDHARGRQAVTLNKWGMLPCWSALGRGRRLLRYNRAGHVSMFRKATPTAPEPFSQPDWTGDVGQHLETLRAYAEAKIHNELSWYVDKKAGRAKTSQRLRFSAVVLSILGGLVPLLIAMFGGQPSWHWLSLLGDVRFGQLGYVFLAITGGLILLDRYFGYSTGWMRF